jgi:hypothetical protein
MSKNVAATEELVAAWSALSGSISTWVDALEGVSARPGIKEPPNTKTRVNRATTAVTMDTNLPAPKLLVFIVFLLYIKSQIFLVD